jgi:hypothetical protein
VDYSDAMTCEAREKAQCLSSISAPGTGNTPATVSACAAAFTSWSCPDWWNNVTPQACKAQQGTIANGATCVFAAQCSTGYCMLPRGAKCGTCATAPQVGTSCAAGNGCGGNGLYCDSISDTCEAFVTTAGTFCDAGSCGYLLGCVVPTDGGAGTCQPLGTAVDAGCDSQQHNAPACSNAFGFACVRRHCVEDLFAYSASACGLNVDAGTFTRCNAGATCVAGDGGSTCVAAAAEGFACDTALGINCLAPARCVSTNGNATDGGPVVGTCQLSSGVTCQ